MLPNSEVKNKTHLDTELLFYAEKVQIVGLTIRKDGFSQEQ